MDVTMETGPPQIMPTESMEHFNPQLQQVISLEMKKLTIRRRYSVATVVFLLHLIQRYI